MKVCVATITSSWQQVLPACGRPGTRLQDWRRSPLKADRKAKTPRMLPSSFETRNKPFPKLEQYFFYMIRERRSSSLSSSNIGRQGYRTPTGLLSLIASKAGRIFRSEASRSVSCRFEISYGFRRATVRVLPDLRLAAPLQGMTRMPWSNRLVAGSQNQGAWFKSCNRSAEDYLALLTGRDKAAQRKVWRRVNLC